MTNKNTTQAVRKRGQKIAPSEIDKMVGMRIRIARNMAGKKQEDLAQYLGLTLQQTQKYENGKNKISVNVLVKIAKYFRIPVSYFIPMRNSSSQEQTINTFNNIDAIATRQVAESWQPIGHGEDVKPASRYNLSVIIDRIYEHGLENEACKVLHELINSKIR